MTSTPSAPPGGPRPLRGHVTVFGRATLFIAVLLLSGLTWPAVGRARLVTYADVRDVLATLSDILPPELEAGDPSKLETTWSTWIEGHDREIRARLERGDADTIVNWLRFGTSFTARPRALPETPAAEFPSLIAARAKDLWTALSMPAQDERRLFTRTFFERRGYRFSSPEDRSRLERHLVAEIGRVSVEQAEHARELAAIRRLSDVSEQFALRSRLFRDRGLSLDTSIVPGFALEQALQKIRTDGLITPSSIKRVAVVGPGLDFADKAAGYDFYPQQTLQPFALIDTLLRLGLAEPAGVTITTFDISPRVNDHLSRARARARSDAPYVLRLPLDPTVPWRPDLRGYWRRLGDRIGVELRATMPAPEVKALEVRTVRVRPAVALQVVPEDLDIVAQRFDGPPFDLIVATNIFVYYDTLDQSLALANVQAMLRRGGLMLSNNALLELPVLRMRSVGYMTVPYSQRPDDGDHIVWYQRLAD